MKKLVMETKRRSFPAWPQHFCFIGGCCIFSLSNGTWCDDDYSARIDGLLHIFFSVS
jgi:hypothetical protein